MWMYKDRNEEEIHGNCLTLGSNSEFRLVVLSYSPVQCFTSMIIRILNRDTPFHFQTHHETDNLLWFGPHYWVSVREMPLYWWMQVLFRMFLYWKHAPNENFSIYIYILYAVDAVWLFLLYMCVTWQIRKRISADRWWDIFWKNIKYNTNYIYTDVVETHVKFEY